jgi:hypothetical protein
VLVVVVVVAMAMASSLRYTSPLAQVAILGLVCFCFPGMFNAINGLGAAGKSDPTITDNANTALAVTFAVCSLLAGAIFNVLGHRAMLILGGFTYILYIGSYLSYNAVFVITAGALLGTTLLSDVNPPLCACACFIFLCPFGQIISVVESISICSSSCGTHAQELQGESFGFTMIASDNAFFFFVNSFLVRSCKPTVFILIGESFKSYSTVLLQDAFLKFFL